MGILKRLERPLEVTVPGDRRPHGIRVHRSATLARRDITRQRGLAVTSPARTLLDLAPRLSERQLARAVNDARLARYLHLADLVDLLERIPRHPGARRLRPFADAHEGPTRSTLEDAFLEFCARFELPTPEINVMIAGREADAVFRAERLIVELDGYGFHDGRAAFEDDRERDAQALASGLATIRVTHARITQAPDREAVRLHAILERRRSYAALKDGEHDAPTGAPIAGAPGQRDADRFQPRDYGGCGSDGCGRVRRRRIRGKAGLGWAELGTGRVARPCRDQPERERGRELDDGSAGRRLACAPPGLLRSSSVLLNRF